MNDKDTYIPPSKGVSCSRHRDGVYYFSSKSPDQFGQLSGRHSTTSTAQADATADVLGREIRERLDVCKESVHTPVYPEPESSQVYKKKELQNYLKDLGFSSSKAFYTGMRLVSIDQFEDHFIFRPSRNTGNGGFAVVDDDLYQTVPLNATEKQLGEALSIALERCE